MPLVLARAAQWRMSPQSLGSMKPDTSMGELASRVMNLENVIGEFMSAGKQQMDSITTLVKNNDDHNKVLNNSKQDEADVYVDVPDESDDTYKVDSYAARTSASIQVEKRLQPQQYQQQPEQVLRSMLQKIVTNNSEKPKPKPKSKNIFYGNIQTTGDEAADVDLVAFNVSKKVEPEKLKKFLEDKGLVIKDVECLTRSELLVANKVRSKTMKVTIKVSEQERAMNPDVWPFHVGVRLYKTSRRRETGDSLWSDGTKVGGDGSQVGGGGSLVG